MSENHGLIATGGSRVGRNKRYIFWFWILNVLLAFFGTAAFRRTTHALLDHRLYAGRLTDHFDLAVLGELLFRPEFGQMSAISAPALLFSCLFFVATTLFLPGVFAGYASTYRLPREDFFRACGRNIWRFIRLVILSGIVMGVIAGVLFSINAAIVKKAGEGTNEVLPFALQMTGVAVIFLIMTALRIVFDLAEVDIVLNDQNAVRKSIAAGFRQTFRSLPRLLAAYVLTTMVAGLTLLAGLWLWLKLPGHSVAAAFAVGQITLLLLLIPRFWQRGIAVSYWLQHMLVPVTPRQPIEPAPAAAVVEPETPPPVTTTDIVPEGGTS